MKFTIALSTVLLIANHAFGQLAGDLDLNFNGNGYVTHDFGFQDNASGVVMQADQKIIVTGTALSPSFMGTLKIMRLNQDGSIDSAFADNGVFSFSVTAETYGVESFVRDDGKIVVGGLAAYNYGYYDILLLRINADGSIDSTFGTNGYTIINYSTRDDLTQAITEQPDGKIVVSGTIMDTTVFKNIPTLLRFNEDGIIDSTFGNNGLMQFPVAEPDNELSSVMVQADGKILASGHYQNVFTGATDFDILMVRTDSSGMPDTAFGTNGMVTTSVNGGIDDAFGMAIDLNNEIILCGFTTSPNLTDDGVVLKYDINGNLISNFGNNGKVLLDYSDFDVCMDVLIQPDNKIVTGGSAGQPWFGPRDFALWRLLPDGSLDTLFGISGMVTTAIQPTFQDINAVSLQSDMKIVAAGRVNMNADNDFGIARYHNGGFASVSDAEVIRTSVYPNPSASSFSIQFNKMVANGLIEIFNSTGQKVYEQSFTDSDFQSITLTGNNSGMYILKLTTGDGVTLQRIAFIK